MIEPSTVEVIRSCICPISVASVGWYPTAEGMRPSSADTSDPAWVKRKTLSTKKRTSCFSTSRKYSATVSPVSPTRRRAPGGSFIWPYTSATDDSSKLSSLIRLDSLNSSQRSVPSRVRSPTPANTERPPCPLAMLLISSMMTTVLPTPAPPKRPILPPFTYGVSRSSTLIPVSSTSVFASRLTNFGASRWIGQRSADAGMSPRWSTGSPSTFMIRPRLGRPTGTVMAWPVSSTAIPRTTPSVEDMATARTWLRPMCCCTSSVTSSSGCPSPAGRRTRSAL